MLILMHRFNPNSTGIKTVKGYNLNVGNATVMIMNEARGQVPLLVLKDVQCRSQGCCLGPCRRKGVCLRLTFEIILKAHQLQGPNILVGPPMCDHCFLWSITNTMKSYSHKWRFPAEQYLIWMQFNQYKISKALMHIEQNPLCFDFGSHCYLQTEAQISAFH